MKKIRRTTIIRRRAYRCYFDRVPDGGPYSVLVLSDTFDRALEMVHDAFPELTIQHISAEKHSYFDEKKLEPEVILI